MNNILKRIEQLAINEGLTITFLESKIGASRGVFSRALAKNTDIQSKWIIRLVENYPLYSTDWILTGKGEMLKKEKNEDSTELTALYKENRELLKEISYLKGRIIKMQDEQNAVKSPDPKPARKVAPELVKK